MKCFVRVEKGKYEYQRCFTTWKEMDAFVAQLKKDFPEGV